MGQAKEKGDVEKRKIDALKMLRKQLPASIQCAHCGRKLEEILPARELSKKFEISQCGLAYCEHCNKVSVCLGDKDSSKLESVSKFLMNENAGATLRAIFEKEKGTLTDLSILKL